MAEKTADSEEVSREEVADRLQALAHELREEDAAEIQVGNKTVELTPASTITYDIAIEERSPMIGSDTEAITLDLTWNPETNES
ncbi:amphi-Trp domain-containing protein [Haladaptatus halobius]|uniref:amphi-Trp domain-containing protein n=1 Tax=Haladaptatus halobius TaxID=2884875 RepID=UPI001D0AD0EC|nr:amphi-Trp domain-containing protein [Haladaptatus halobius]